MLPDHPTSPNVEAKADCPVFNEAGEAPADKTKAACYS
jgi:hypothetical protein